MTTTTLIKTTEKPQIAGATYGKPKITVFHCFNAINDLSAVSNDDFKISAVKMPCSSMTREVFLLRAFEAGADAVIILVCPEGSCHYIDGNIRATRRVTRIKKLLDEIGLDGWRLNIFNIKEGDQAAIEAIISRTVSDISNYEPVPAA